jgi:hypothetical protein
MAMVARVCDELGIVTMRWKTLAELHSQSLPAAPVPLPGNNSSPSILRAMARRVSLVAVCGRLHTEAVTRPALVAG